MSYNRDGSRYGLCYEPYHKGALLDWLSTILWHLNDQVICIASMWLLFVLPYRTIEKLANYLLPFFVQWELSISSIGSRAWIRRPLTLESHDDIIKWKHFPRCWPFVRRIHRSPVNSPHTDQWRRALMFSLIYAWINGWVNNREAGDLRRHLAHCDVTVMQPPNPHTPVLWFSVLTNASRDRLISIMEW